jgi:hypothetical protein
VSRPSARPGQGRDPSLLRSPMWRRSNRRTCGVGRSISLSDRAPRGAGFWTDLTRVPLSAIARAGNPGETGSIALANNPAMSSAATSLSGTVSGHAPTRLFARCSAPRCRGPHGLGGKEVLPSQRKPTWLAGLTRRRSWGSSLRRFTPAGGWADISAGPFPRAVCVEKSNPIDFRRGDRSPCCEVRRSKERRST